MSRRTIFWIVLCAVVLHVGAFLVLSRMSPLPKTRFVAPPNFGYKKITYVDTTTGEKTIEREYRVSTKLAAPGTYEPRLPSEAERRP